MERNNAKKKSPPGRSGKLSVSLTAEFRATNTNINYNLSMDAQSKFKDSDDSDLKLECVHQGCKVKFDQYQREAFEKHVIVCRRRIVKCPGCSNRMQKRKVKSHNCDGQPTTCSQCGADFPNKKDLQGHSEICPQRIVKCDLCRRDLITATSLFRPNNNVVDALGVVLSFHESNECPQRQVTCTDCNERLTACFMSFHQSALCQNRTIACSGCDKKYIARDEDEHERECPGRSVTCSKCGMSCEARALKQHERFICNGQSTILSCFKCGQAVSALKWIGHVWNCSGILQCKKCGAKVPYNALDSHVCPGDIVDGIDLAMKAVTLIFFLCMAVYLYFK